MSQRNIEVITQEGCIFVPSSNEVDEVPFLAVTMCVFGQFEVTHVPSGRKLVGGFERAVNAFVSMFELQLAINELKVDLNGDYKYVQQQVKDKDNECEALGGLTLKQWISVNTTIGNICSEFPWETENEGPHADLERLAKKLKLVKVK